ncbi:chorismate mutase [Candidatus Peregrinibacteria bacterium]|jgi:chorismate mutase|nr:chorismate mutase [Candidatus Peregrinibacteria bacterium]MBT4631472.1 chorismate mutase [Candidatus Peregrinibacteria bacterium]MBT5516495.1 chorismate mutase [Candidatus Peregrinibacteria bacterium]MBT5823861.1 chorismate mutase [Candidatus Peregrinibacteria bacterium]
MLEKLRKEIENLDSMLLKILGQRFKLVKQIHRIKKDKELEVEDLDREAKLKEFHERIAKAENINPQLVEKIFSEIFSEAKK